MIIVAIAPSLIWPPKKPAVGRLGGLADSTARRDSTAHAILPPPSPAKPPNRRTAQPLDTGRIVWVTSPLYRLGFSTRGGRLVSAELLNYQSFASGDSARPVQLVPSGDAFLRHRLIAPSGDTVSLDDWDFQPTPDAPGLLVSAGRGAQSLHLEAERGGSRVTLEYRFAPDEYRFEVRGNVTGLSSGGAALRARCVRRIRLDHDARCAGGRFPLPGIRGSPRLSPAIPARPRSRRCQPLRRHFPSDHSAGLGIRRQHPAVDARTPEPRLRVGAHSVRRDRAPAVVAIEPEGDGVRHPHAGGRAVAQGDAGPLQERSRAAAARDDAHLQREQGESVRRVSPDAAADARAAGALLRIRQHDRISWRAVPVAPGSLAGRSLSYHPRDDWAGD